MLEVKTEIQFFLHIFPITIRRGSLQIGYSENVFYFSRVLHKSTSLILLYYSSYFKNICLYTKNTKIRCLRLWEYRWWRLESCGL